MIHVVVLSMVLVLVLILSVVPWVVVVSSIVVFVEIPLLVAYETTYLTVVLEVSIEVVMVYVFVIKSIIDRKFVALSIFGIPTIILVTLVVYQTWLVVVGIVFGTLCVSQVDLHWVTC